MVSFHYCRINSNLIEELKENVLRANSIVLLGPRYGGKKYVINQLRQRLEETGVTPLVQIDLPKHDPVATADGLFSMIYQAVKKADESCDRAAELNGGLLSPVVELANRVNKPVVFMVTHVDGMAHSLARLLLQAVRTHVMSGKIIAVLSGEMDLRTLVHGPNSEFNCTDQYVMQGFDLDEFRGQVNQYARALNIRFENDEESTVFLWRLTGGNVHKLRTLLYAILDSHLRTQNDRPICLKTSEIPDSLNKVNSQSIGRAEVFHQVTRLINHEPGCWPELEKLIGGEAIKVVGPGDAPNRLEMAGVAVRDGTTLKLSSPLMGDFLRYYYTPRKFGDYYARNGRWKEAFAKFALLSPEDRLRPLSTDDRAEVLVVMKALSAALYLAAAEGVESVQNLFAQGCRYILGFSEVSFWEHNGGWRSRPLKGFQISKDAEEAALKILPQGIKVSPGLWPIKKDWIKYGVAAILPAIQTDRRGAVVICNFEKKIAVSRERELLAEDLLKHFIYAYTHAISVEAERARLVVRNKHIEVMNLIFEGLGSDLLNSKHVLTLAARGLRDLGYRRVLFCLVDPEKKRIKGVLDSCDDLSIIDVAAETDYSLDEPLSDLQPYVIYTREAKIIEDASVEPLANKKVVRRAQMRAEAIVPIINLGAEAIGTIHIEREDGVTPSRDEVEDLAAFGRQLAVAIELCDRVNLLQSTLNKIPEPVAIVDKTESLRYVNEPAARLFNVEAGWRDRATDQLLSEQKVGKHVMEMIRKSYGTGRRIVGHLKEVGSRHAEVMADVIKDWQGATIGNLLHIHDLSSLYDMAQDFKSVFEASNTQSAIEATLSAAKPKFKWGRLYLIDENDPDQFVSKSSFGFNDPLRKERFDRGEYRLPRRGAQEVESWMSVEKNTPLVFYFTKDLPNFSTHVTLKGLEVIVVNNPHLQEEVEREPGEFWIDIPLGTPEHPLGKLTLDCDVDLSPEDFELMKLFIERTSSFLIALMRRDEIAKMIRVDAAEEAMGAWAHNIATRLASLPIVLTRYRTYEKKYPGLRDVNERFSQILDETLSMMSQVKGRLAPILAQASEIDLAEQIERTLRSALPDTTWKFDCVERPVLIKADGNLMRNALLELIQNSKEIRDGLSELQIDVSLEDGEDSVKIVYRDNGPGVPDELKERIFDEFFSRRPGQKTSTGLGLSFASRVAKAHGGSIEERGSYGEGAEFVIRIPRISAKNLREVNSLCLES